MNLLTEGIDLEDLQTQGERNDDENDGGDDVGGWLMNEISFL